MRPRLRFAVTLTAAVLYAAVTLLGPDLHSLACAHHGQECHAAGTLGTGFQANDPQGSHDTENCPICQAFAQAHAALIGSTPASSTLCLRRPLVACDQLAPLPAARLHLARGPPVA
ncbi:MAG TPA: hypothetical protein VHY20_14040 [Pirellulales bacterium]|jgi:hypothetical protein|nr:hypothetical protein [Pirellulales bacterium]